MTDAEIDKMIKEAERNRSADDKRKAEIEITNLADTSIYSAEKALRDFADKLDANLKSGIEKQIEAVRKAKEGRDTDKIKAAVEDLQRSIQQIGASMYEQPGGAGAAGAGFAEPDGKNNGEDVIEGEVVE